MLGSFLCIAEGLPPLFPDTSSKDLLPLPTALLHPLPCRHSFHKKIRNISYRNGSKHTDCSPETTWPLGSMLLDFVPDQGISEQSPSSRKDRLCCDRVAWLLCSIVKVKSRSRLGGDVQAPGWSPSLQPPGCSPQPQRPQEHRLRGSEHALCIQEGPQSPAGQS